VIADGRLFHGVDSGEVIARDPADAASSGAGSFRPAFPPRRSSRAILLFVASSSRSIYALRARERTAGLAVRAGLDVSGSWAPPVVSGSRVYFTSNVGTVYAFEPAGDDIQFIGTWDSGPRILT